MQCSDFHKIVDSYLGDELLIETNHEVIAHLEACSACRRELAARRELRVQLRAAFASSAALQPSPAFTNRLRAQLRAKALHETTTVTWGQWMAIAASILLIITAGLLATRQTAHNTSIELANSGRGNQNEATRIESPQPNASRDAVNLFMAKAAELAAGDHRDCAIDYKLAEEPISLEEAGRRYDRAYINLASAVMSQQKQLAGGMQFVEAHSCVFNGKRFGHIILKEGNHLVSVLVTDLDNAPSEIAAQSSPEARQAVVNSSVGGYQVSYLATAKHGIFIVSDLEAARNSQIAGILVPSVYEHVKRTERLT